MAKELSAWEEKLTADRDQLVADIATAERDLALAQDEAHGRLAAIPRGARNLAMVEETALERIPPLEAKLGVLRRAVSSIETAIEAAPPRVKKFQETLPPLAFAQAQRDEAMFEATERLREFLAALLELRETNTAAVAKLTAAMRAWGSAGHVASDMPQFRSTRWSAEIRGWLRTFRSQHYAVPFVDLELTDDTSNPLARAYPSTLRTPEAEAEAGRVAEE